MRVAVLALLTIAVCLADDLPTLTDSQRIEVREAQLRATRAENVRLQLAALIPELQDADREVTKAQMALRKLVGSLLPADCADCLLEEDLTWKRPAPPEPTKEEQP